MTQSIYIGKQSDGRASMMDLRLANRHGLVAGATGTGKTVTLQILAEAFSAAGVPVFATDIKGDLSGVAKPGTENANIKRRSKDLGIEWNSEQFPVKLWDLFGEEGERITATVEDMGPMLMAKLLGLTPTQTGVLNVVFSVAQTKGMPLKTLTDMQTVLRYTVDNATEISQTCGYVSPSTIGIVMREVTGLLHQGADSFFGESVFDVSSLMDGRDEQGRATINLLSADRLMESPQTYVAFMVWLMNRLFQVLPEVGDPEKPRMVFFFDEAHLLFSDAPKMLMQTIERVVRLIRSKGVGIYFVTQSPRDIPDNVLAQLGNRFQHALRAFTPRDQAAVKAAADTFRANAALDVRDAITSLGRGEALVSTLEGNGIPGVVQRVMIRPPQGHIGALTEEERKLLLHGAPTPTPLLEAKAPMEPVPAVQEPTLDDFPKTTIAYSFLTFGMILGTILGAWLF